MARAPDQRLIHVNDLYTFSAIGIVRLYNLTQVSIQRAGQAKEDKDALEPLREGYNQTAHDPAGGP
jgi:hypothetical protein